MKIKPKICTECATRIKGYGFVCWDIMQEVCENEIVFFEDNDNPLKTIMAFLECKNFIVTTELENEIIAAIANKKASDYVMQTALFCWCKNTL